MTRRAAVVASTLAAAIALAPAGPPAGARDTGIEGRVGELLELSLRRVAPRRADVTITATVRHTRLTATAPGRGTRVLGDYRAPMTRRTVKARAAVADARPTTVTITFGPEGP